MKSNWTPREIEIIRAAKEHGFLNNPRKMKPHQFCKKTRMKYRFVEETIRKLRHIAVKEYLKNNKGVFG